MVGRVTRIAQQLEGERPLKPTWPGQTKGREVLIDWVNRNGVQMMKVGYLSRLPKAGEIPEGMVLLDNSVRPKRRRGQNGFRSWVQKPVGLEECDCGCPVGRHYRVNR
jgi:hypothetical protein